MLYRMHREAKHVMKFLFAEMGISGFLDGQKRLVVEGKFAAKVFEGVLKRYISKLLLQLCQTCLSRLNT
ncbi:hypothetical protein MKW94_000630 [Papaver nudicaule]|uniref:Translation initiation factor IF2/IF5 domain-containing protein n=1 Tax=Papaver nudicaule TaxID=74823 RepID=A0AA41SEZ4_PAPNU|nr:hypothetical protein [Papaver nudicaule]MCL7036974.1 hypothetical protein [Papaver nudicaule]